MMRPKYKTKVESRSDLLTLLTEACELEHGLACSYLYAAFSLKQELSEGGMSWDQLHLVRKWAAQIYLVASQEMFHLSQAWNLLSAIGGSPYYLRPNFPQNNKYYPINAPLTLEPFSEDCIKRFMQYELPQELEPSALAKAGKLGLRSMPFEYKTVGALYQMVSDGFSELSKNDPHFFLGDESLQIGQEEIDFPEIVKVKDNESAQEAIHKIMEQGEGTTQHHDDCHYGIFKQMLEQFQIEKEKSGFEPVRKVINNPVVYARGDLQSTIGTEITDPFTVLVADLFDDTYNLMLRSLQFVFGATVADSENKKKLARFSIGMMPMIIKPLGDILMQLPVGINCPELCAGPAFTMSRHVTLPQAFDVAIIILTEGFEGLAHRSLLLSKDPMASASLVAVAQNFERLKNYLL